MLWNHQTFLAGSPLAGRRTSIYSSAQMPHLQNCVTILNLRVLRTVRGGCGWCGRSKIGKMSWGRGMWYSGGGEKCCRCLGNPSGVGGVKGCPSVTWFGSEGSLTSHSSCTVLGMSCSSCKLAALPLVAVGHADVACPGFPHIMQRLFSQWCLCSSGFSLPSGPRMRLLTWVAGGLVLLGPCRFAFIGGLLSLWHASFHSSCLSQYRLS